MRLSLTIGVTLESFHILSESHCLHLGRAGVGLHPTSDHLHIKFLALVYPCAFYTRIYFIFFDSTSHQLTFLTFSSATSSVT